ncbi:hypothetical protein GCM10010345_93730 [Streptomyces canarius]|uniref:Uncharacterized protein n=1 Tax=Streptomyces canarius TaxID=285453 RepID=A0ABQ3DE45_9ACTN|nr:hypothetical protein GCM10010345_93730 [Streptomyces canarius]
MGRAGRAPKASRASGRQESATAVRHAREKAGVTVRPKGLEDDGYAADEG